MKIFIKKYAFALVPLFLCLLTLSFKPNLLQAQDAGSGSDTTGTPGSTDFNADFYPNTSPTDTTAPSPNTTGNPASPNTTGNGSASSNPSGGTPNTTGTSPTAGSSPNGTSLGPGGIQTPNNSPGGIQTPNNSPGGIQTPANPSSGTFYLQNPLSSQFTTVGGIVGGFIQIFAYLVVLFAVLMIIYVGLRLVLAQGNAEEITKRREQLLWLVVGVAIVIGARIIVQVVISTLQSTGTINQNVITNAQNALKNQ